MSNVNAQWRTIKALAVFTALMTSVFVVAARQDPPPPRPQFRAGVDIFQFEVTVLDQSRHPVRGLTAADFTVLENGKPQPIVGFSEVEFPEGEGPQTEAGEEVAPDVTAQRYADRRLITLVMDDFGMSSGAESTQLAFEAKRIGRRITDSFGPADFGAVVLTRDTRFFPDFTNDRWKLSGSINEFRPPTDGERMYLFQVTRGHIGALPALQDVIAYLTKLPQHRKMIIYVGTGAGTSPSIGSRAIDIYRDAQVAGISISSVDVAGLTLGRRGDGLLTLAENTGGYAVVGTNGLDAGIAQIFRENHAYYLLGYQQTGPADGKYRRLDVHVSRPGLTVHTRSGYTAPGKPDMVKAPTLPFDPGVDAAVTALTRALDERRLFTYAVARSGVLGVAAEIATVEAGAHKWGAGADVEVKVTRGAGALIATARGRIEAGARGTWIDVPLQDASGQPLVAGQGPFHVSVRVTASGDSLEDGGDAVDDGLWLGPPRVFRAGSAPRAPMRPVAEFQFARTERIRIEWPELKPFDERHARLLRRNGEALEFVPTLADTPIAGGTGLSTELPLASMAPGDYVIEVVAGRGTEAERKLVAFRVVQ